MQIGEPQAQRAVAPVWRLAFRAGFLAAGLFAVAGMLRWLAWLQWPAHWDYSIHPAWWHAHEMVFGFAMPVVAGFLLSAVATWTGLPGTRGRRLQVLFGLWLAARLVLWLAPAYAIGALIAELLFIALLLWELGSRVWAVRQWRNSVFLPVLLAIAALDIASYATMADFPATTRVHYAAVWMITVLIVIIGGRVTPLFTGNRLGAKIPPLPAWFEHLALAITVAVAAVALHPSQPHAGAASALYLAGAAIHGIRLARWQGWRTGAIPLLWSMHLAYLCIPLSMLGLALAGGDPAAIRNLMHLLAIGSIGGMILAMMSRVALGHTGRPLEVPGYIALAFAALFIAALTRALLPVLDVNLSPWAWRVSGLLWIAAFTLFLVHYTAILVTPRADGRDG